MKAFLNRTVNELAVGTLVEIRQRNENTCLVRTESEPNIEHLVSKDALDNGTMYFKHEGSYYSYKLSADGKPVYPNGMYVFGSLQTLSVRTRTMAKQIAKEHGLTAVFG